jgi:natural product precursor
MKNLEFLGQEISEEEMKHVMGGGTGVLCYGAMNCDGDCYSFSGIDPDDFDTYCPAYCASLGKTWYGICSGTYCVPV